jgi:hypothetical protein
MLEMVTEQQTKKQGRKQQNLTQKQTIQTSYKLVRFDTQFKLASYIFNDITIKNELQNNKLYFYWIISKKYNEYLASNKYLVIHFLLYCLLRFSEGNLREIIDKYILYPANFPTRINFEISTKYSNYNSFNYLLYLNNFIYHLFETNQSLYTFIKESKITKWGYNVSLININNKPYYNIYYVVKLKTDLAKSAILTSNNYPKYFLEKYISYLESFLKKNINELMEQGFITNVYKFNLTHTLDFKNKFFIINDLYIPKCHIDIKEEQPIDVYMHLLTKEINYPTIDRLRILSRIALKYRNLDKLENDLVTASISKDNFNDMIRSIKPLGFSNKKQYRNFIHDIAKIVKTRFNNFTIKIIGSGTTFYSASPKPEKADKYYSIHESDIDVNIIPNEDFTHYKSELETLADGQFNVTIGVYVNPLTRSFFGENLMEKFFKKWGPQELGNFPKIYAPVDIDKTILKRHISITITTKRDLFEYFDTIRDNKTCLTNFSTFVTNGNTLSYWMLDKLITEKL